MNDKAMLMNIVIIKMDIQKNLRSSFGDVDLDIPKDRKAKFQPKIVKKYETVCNELYKKIIQLYAKGMTTTDIQPEIEDLYGINISPQMVFLV